MSSDRKKQPVIPSTVEEINPEWVSKILSDEIDKDEFQLEENIQSGSGYLSSMTRLSCKSVSTKKKYQIIIKLLPNDETMRGLVISEGFDKTEINFYKTTIPDLVRILPELQHYLCKSYYGHIQEEDPSMGIEYASILVMEDLKPQGYYTINFAGQESKEQIQEVLQFMAKFHFAGIALEEERKQSLTTIYNFLQGSDAGADSMFYEMAKAGFDEVQGILTKNGAAKDVVDSYKSIASHSDIIIKMVQDASKEFSCLIHGDLWSNNLLFNENPQYNTKVIDWQLLGYKDPTYDLAVTIVSSVPISQLNHDDVDVLLRYYYQQYTNQCKESNMEHLVKRDWNTFSQFFYSWGMSFTLLWFLMASDPFAENIPRLVKIYEFLAKEVNVPQFLLSKI